MTFWVGGLDAVLEAVTAAAASAGARPGLTGSAGAGVLYACLEPGTDPAIAGRFAGELRDRLGGSGPAGPRGAVLVLTGPEAVMAAAGTYGSDGAMPGAALMRAIKDQFDPDHRMFPGREGG
jgi:glycolate oxidase FAD binding subunit